MLSIIIAFPKIDDANKIRTLVVKNGFQVHAVCTSGSSVIGLADGLSGGIVICGCRLADMHYSELYTYLPKGFEMLLMASPAKYEDSVSSNIVFLSMPIKTQDLLGTLQMMSYNSEKRTKKDKKVPIKRNPEEKARIDKAKYLLMDRNNMTEEEAHRYIQKASMDSGTNMAETAEMILCLMNE